MPLPSTSPPLCEDSPKVQLARRIARDLIDEPDALFVHLVGSVATGTDSADSDVDVIVAIDRDIDMSEEYQEHDGIRLGIERYPASHFLQLAETPILDLEGLRNCGRFDRGHVLASRWPDLERVQRAWRHARLDPNEAKELFDLADAYLDPELLAQQDSDTDGVWMIQGAASAVAMMALVLEPCRFQKPKWVLHDLRAAGADALVQILDRVHMNGTVGAAEAERCLQASEASLAEACRMANLPLLSFDPSHGATRVYIHQTHRDAVSLWHDGDHSGCAFTALYALRLMNIHLQRDDAPPSEEVAPELLGAWRIRALETALPGGPPSLESLADAIHGLRTILDDLRRRYAALPALPPEILAAGPQTQ